MKSFLARVCLSKGDSYETTCRLVPMRRKTLKPFGYDSNKLISIGVIFEMVD
jgi:hypothetical protein